MVRYTHHKDKVLVIVGPTTSGKSSLAVKLAQKFNGEIISADSRQVYKYLNVGTGKISKKEMMGIPHHLLDIENPKRKFSASRYKNLAENVLRDILKNNKLPIVAGGTGFYIDALAGKISLPEVDPNPLLRKKLEKKSTEELFKILKKKDPERAVTIDPHNKIRLIRALEIIEAIGKVPKLQSSYHYSFIYIGLKPDKDELDKMIYQRLMKRQSDIIKETSNLIKTKAISYKRLYELGLEYRYAGMYLEKKISKDEMIEKLYTEIKRYAKRQLTWFKRNKKIRWFTLSSSGSNTVEGFNLDKHEDIEKYIESKLKGTQ